jgi:hypothetical protein
VSGRFFKGIGSALRRAYGPPYEREDHPVREPTMLEGAGELRQAARHLSKVAEKVAPGVVRAPCGEEREDQLQGALRRLTEGMRGS